MIFTAHQILFKNEMGWASGKHGVQERWVEGFGGKT